jgi:uncharacterized glyoxalase superfamily protein PhnB
MKILCDECSPRFATPWSATNHTSAVSHRQRQSDWKLANEIGAHIIIPLADRYYGLRDFTIADPDDFGVPSRGLFSFIKYDPNAV